VFYLLFFDVYLGQHPVDSRRLLMCARVAFFQCYSSLLKWRWWLKFEFVARFWNEADLSANAAAYAKRFRVNASRIINVAAESGRLVRGRHRRPAGGYLSRRLNHLLQFPAWHNEQWQRGKATDRQWRSSSIVYINRYFLRFYLTYFGYYQRMVILKKC